MGFYRIRWVKNKPKVIFHATTSITIFEQDNKLENSKITNYFKSCFLKLFRIVQKNV